MSMFKVNTIFKRTITNCLFGMGILLILLIAVSFRYYIDKQTNLDMGELNKMVEEEITKK